jgi:hypothetical protein
MLNNWAVQAFTDSQARTRDLVSGSRWPARRWHAKMLLLQEGDWFNPPLGLTALPRPELAEGKTLPGVVSTVLVATDGLELESGVAEGQAFDLDAQLAHLTSRTPPGGHPYPHGDIAAVRITATLA